MTEMSEKLEQLILQDLANDIKEIGRSDLILRILDDDQEDKSHRIRLLLLPLVKKLNRVYFAWAARES